MPKSVQRCSTNMSNSSKEPSSSSRSMRSRAVSLPLGVLGFDALLAAAFPRPPAPVFKLFQDFLHAAPQAQRDATMTVNSMGLSQGKWRASPSPLRRRVGEGGQSEVSPCGTCLTPSAPLSAAHSPPKGGAENSAMVGWQRRSSNRRGYSAPRTSV